MTTPLSPQEAAAQKHTVFPDNVIEAINHLILKRLVSRTVVVKAVVTKDEVVAELERLGYLHEEIEDNGWLDFEGIYREMGWDVVYDAPGYNESYTATYTFEAKRGK